MNIFQRLWKASTIIPRTAAKSITHRPKIDTRRGTRTDLTPGFTSNIPSLSGKGSVAGKLGIPPGDKRPWDEFYERPTTPLSETLSEEEKKSLETSPNVPKSEAELQLKKLAYLVQQARGLDDYETEQWIKENTDLREREAFREDQQAQLDAERMQQMLGEEAGRIGEPGMPGQIDPTTGMPMGLEAPPIDYRQAFLVGTSTAVGAGIGLGTLKAIFGAGAAGAVAGGKVGMFAGPKGALAGIIIGAGIAGVYAAYKNIGSQTSGEISGLNRNVASNERIMREQIAYMNLDPDNAAMYVDAYNAARDKISQDNAILHLMTQQDLRLSLGKDGTTAKYRYEAFLRPGGMAETLDQKARLSLGAPDPNAGMMMLSSLNMIGGEE